MTFRLEFIKIKGKSTKIYDWLLPDYRKMNYYVLVQQNTDDVRICKNNLADFKEEIVIEMNEYKYSCTDWWNIITVMTFLHFNRYLDLKLYYLAP